MIKRSGLRLAAMLALLVGAGTIAAGSVSATFHEISIREIYPGSIAQPESQYVELQMWSPGQNFVANHFLRTYNTGGGVNGTTTFGSSVSGGANQSTILLATPAAEAEFGVASDKTLAPGQLSPAGGAVCWEELDCVSWGNFAGSLPSPAGTPAAPGGIPDGMALRRTIAPGCPSLLEPSDDHDNSAADFTVVFPAPRPNSVAPSEHSCPASGDQSGGSAGKGPPQTLLKRKPPHRTSDPTPTFRFAADETGVTFQCKLDGKPFKRCRSPFTTNRLDPGRHTFKVRARDDSGKQDPTPAFYSFRVIVKP
jgi:hypothetical protein